MSGFEKRAIPWLAAKLTGQKVGKAPLAPGLARGERGTFNHGWMARALELVVNGDPQGLCSHFYNTEHEQGHQGREFMTASHFQHHAGAHAAIMLEAQQRAGDYCDFDKGFDYEVLVAHSIMWFATHLALCRRFYEPGVRSGSVVAPGARGWGGWKKGSVPSAEQWSWLRDEWVKYADKGKPFKGAYSAGLDQEVVALLTHPDMPYSRIREAADRVDVANVRVVAPIYEARLKNNTARWWHPPRQVVATRPTVYMAAVLGRADAYSCEPYEPDERERAAAVRIGRVATTTGSAGGDK